MNSLLIQSRMYKIKLLVLQLLECNVINNKYKTPKNCLIIQIYRQLVSLPTAKSL